LNNKSISKKYIYLLLSFIKSCDFYLKDIKLTNDIEAHMRKQRHTFKRFSLIEILIVVAIIGILASFLMPSLSKARRTAREAVCKNNLKQLYMTEMLFADDNENKVYAHQLRAQFMTATSWSNGGVTGNIHSSGEQLLEPYLGREHWSNNPIEVYRCPASSWEAGSWVAGVTGGKNYNGFTDSLYSQPSTFDQFTVRSYGNPNSVFENSSRKPFISDYAYSLDNSKHDLHGNTGSLNLAVSDGSVVKLYLPVMFWESKFRPTWIPYYENALGVSAY
jgi:prepilin-type N-terminal cleavage/methylation domain-containing protein